MCALEFVLEFVRASAQLQLPLSIGDDGIHQYPSESLSSALIYFELYPRPEKERHVYLTCIVVVPIGELMGELELS